MAGNACDNTYTSLKGWNGETRPFLACSWPFPLLVSVSYAPFSRSFGPWFLCGAGGALCLSPAALARPRGLLCMRLGATKV